MKKFITRVITLPEIRKYGYKICLCAEQRYGRKGFVISKDKFNDKVLAAEKYSNAFEFYGVFCEDKLVGFSENYIQNKAVFLGGRVPRCYLLLTKGRTGTVTLLTVVTAEKDDNIRFLKSSLCINFSPILFYKLGLRSG